ncbi:hypothetical protein AGABI2DRAFT_176376 [Agaricus bisporus var. bisporus H97]|uniref:hypothetical protein n=1 Tax=Agaricus bisporus var. bisporus (strain H97 / ATCC MYA-4626 / FGSC 10389) TaxID=936046 RepID=UPI00029F5240|nr:hypothetical protein AGABI2DRAFT_176376 [Agaricus bisporus var. bisporus H97]EKV49726.1 hypothetical protein AGABI2DRAFT_176376 [Agaricus bisporus var. bisporus H97]
MFKFLSSLARKCFSKPEESQVTEKQFSPKALLVLLIGPIGSKVEEFVEKVTGRLSNNSQDSLVVPSEPQIRIQEMDINRTGEKPERIIFLIPTLFDGDSINEKSILENVKKWLRCNRAQKPNIDRILYFGDPEGNYQIPLKPVGVYWSSLKKVCGTDDTNIITDKIAFVQPDGRSSRVRSKVPEEWCFLFERRKNVFAPEEESASNLIDQIINGL